MIERLAVKNFKLLRELEFIPSSGLNIITGDNESGKSSILEAISLVLTGRLDGRRAGEQISPYWFNLDAVKEFFAAWSSGKRDEPPRIEIEAFFDKQDVLARLRGKMNSRKEDAPGLRLAIELDSEFAEEFVNYMDTVRSELPVLPVEYFHVRWVDFCDMPIVRRPNELGSVLIDSRTARSTSSLDWHTRQVIKDLADTKAAAAISVKYRTDRVTMASGMLHELNTRISTSTSELQLGDFSLAADLDTGGWESTVTPRLGDVPLQHAGQGKQVMVKAALALHSSQDRTAFVLMEEPENHLSHTNLSQVLDTVERLAQDRQCFITTHSSFVLNRLGLDKLHLVHMGRLMKFDSLSGDTVAYFQKQTGFDSLRVVLASQVVLVEGPSDEMVFIRAYKDSVGHEPRADGIDVICYGTQHRRPLELCAALDKPAIALRDNDGRPRSHWEALAHGLLSSTRCYFIGDPANGRTLESQIVHANSHLEPTLRKIVGCPDGEDLQEFMAKAKTESAWRIAASNQTVKYPDYIYDAVAYLTK